MSLFFLLFYIFIFLSFSFLVFCLSSSNRLLLNEMVLHVSLEIEVGKLIILGELEKRRKLVISIDLSSVGLVLKTIGADIVIDLLANNRSSHVSANFLTKELSQLITDTGGLHKSRRLSVSRTLLLSGGKLLDILDLARNLSLKELEISLKRGELSGKHLELGTEIVQHQDH